MYDENELKKNVEGEIAPIVQRAQEQEGPMHVSLDEAEQKVIEEREDGREALYDLLDRASKGQVMAVCKKCGTKFAVHPGSNACPCGERIILPPKSANGLDES